MSAPANATVGQIRQLLALFGDAPTTKELQRVLANGDVIMAIAEGRLTRERLLSLLAPPAAASAPLASPLTIPWTPVDQYADKIARWGLFTTRQIDALVPQLTANPHAGDLHPTGVRIWLGKDIEYNRAMAVAILTQEIKALGGGRFLQDYTGPGHTTWYPGSEIAGPRRLEMVGLDFQTFWDSQNGVVVNNVRPQRSVWPGLEVFWLLAFNPQILAAMDGKKVPLMIAPGLVVDSGGVPGFNRVGLKALVDGRCAGLRWCEPAMAAFRDLRP